MTEKTGKHVVEDESLDSILGTMNYYEKTALKFKKDGDTDSFFIYMQYFLGIKNTLERLGLIVREDYDFSKVL